MSHYPILANNRRGVPRDPDPVPSRDGVWSVTWPVGYVQYYTTRSAARSVARRHGLTVVRRTT